MQHTVESPRQLVTCWNLKWNLRFLDFLFCARQSLCNCCFGRQECMTDFRYAEAAECLQGKRHLRFRRDNWVTAYEHHPQSVVGNFVFRKNCSFRCVSVTLHQSRDFGFFRTENFFASDDVEREIAEIGRASCRE